MLFINYVLFLFSWLCSYLCIRGCGVGWWWGDLDKTNDQTVKHTDDISLSFSS